MRIKRYAYQYVIPGLSASVAAVYFYQKYFATKQAGITGLQNYGQTCYFNALIQALSSSKQLRKYLEKTRDRSALARHLWSLFSIVNGEDTSLSFSYQASQLISELKRLNLDSIDRQQDPHELLIVMVDALREEHRNLLDRQRRSLAIKTTSSIPQFPLVVHLGSDINYGHYITYRINDAGQWHCVNDSIVRKVFRHEVMAVQAYLLFYDITDS